MVKVVESIGQRVWPSKIGTRERTLTLTSVVRSDALYNLSYASNTRAH